MSSFSQGSASAPHISMKPVYDAVVLAALAEMELGPFIKRLDEGSIRHVRLAGKRYIEGTINERRVAVVWCGLGREQSAEMTRHMLAYARVNNVFLLGCAGVAKGSRAFEASAAEPSEPGLGAVMVGVNYVQADLDGIIPGLTGSAYEEGLKSVHELPDGREQVLTRYPDATPATLRAHVMKSTDTSEGGVSIYPAVFAASDTFPVGAAYGPLRKELLESKEGAVLALDMEAQSVARQCWIAPSTTATIDYTSGEHAAMLDGESVIEYGISTLTNHDPVPFVAVKGASNFVDEKGHDTGEGRAAEKAFSDAALVVYNAIADLPKASGPSYFDQYLLRKGESSADVDAGKGTPERGRVKKFSKKTNRSRPGSLGVLVRKKHCQRQHSAANKIKEFQAKIASAFGANQALFNKAVGEYTNGPFCRKR